MRVQKIGLLLLATLGSSSVAKAQQSDAGARSVAAFAKHCTSFGPDIAAIRNAMNDDTAWQAEPHAAVDASAFDKVPSLQKMYWYEKPVEVSVWTERSAQPLKIVLGTFGKKKDVRVCAVLVSNIDNATPYFDTFDEVMKSAGLKRRSTDLPHYLEYWGKGSGGGGLRGDIFSRSFVNGEKKSMHLAFGFIQK